MRKNTVEAFKAWQVGKAKKPSSSIWTDGQHVYSYGTRIITREGGRVIFNQEKYSVTTSNHQNSLRFLMAQNGIGWEPAENG